MHPISRLAFAVVAAGMVYKLVRAFRTGQMTGEETEYSLDDNPMTFSLLAGVDVVVVLFFAWLAAGGEAEGFYRWLLPSFATSLIGRPS